MTLIIATLHNLLIVREGEILNNLSEPDIGHYGVTWNVNHLFALFADNTVLDGSHQVIRAFNRNLQPVQDLLYGAIGGVHQIQWYDGFLWVVSTNTDVIVVADDRGNICQHWQPVESEGEHHLNSIWFENGYIYTLTHGLREGDPAIYRHRYPTLELVSKTPAARGGHNVFRDIHMANGCLYRDGQPPVGLGGMVKGLSVTADRVYVGSSQVIEDRQRRHADAYGVIWELDSEFKILKKHELNAGPVNEIRALDQPDYAHHGMPWMGRYGA